MKLEIISGSSRPNSLTHRLALHLQTAFSAKDGLETGLIALKDVQFPIMQTVYRSSEEAPEALRPVATRMFTADAFIIVTPEYNGSYAPAMQNLFDHFPKQQRKPFGLATASPGALGGIRAAMQLQQFVLALFGVPSPYMLITPQIDKKFDPAGALTDPGFQASIDLFVKEFLWLSERLTSRNQA